MGSVRRWLRHAWCDEADVREHLDEAALARLAEQVRASERAHHGEIRIVIESGLDLRRLWQGCTPRQRAVELFGRLGVWDTEANNGVLVYLLWPDRAIEIVADRGLRLPDAHWQSLVQQMGEAFRAGRFEAGLQAAVAAVDQVLRARFPATAGERNDNELPDAPLLLLR